MSFQHSQIAATSTIDVALLLERSTQEIFDSGTGRETNRVWFVPVFVRRGFESGIARGKKKKEESRRKKKNSTDNNRKGKGKQ